ncbi:phytoene desaturase family protein [Thermodesulfobacteriota bacterium]
MGEWDAIVIGAGIGGLTCGGLLAKHGKKVIVLESRSRIAGRATTVDTGEIKMDLGQHSLTAGGHIERALAAIGSKLSFVYQDPTFYVYHDGRFIGVPGKLSGFRNLEVIPSGERTELIDILESIREMPFEDIENYDLMSLKDWLLPLTRSDAIVNIINLLANMFLTTENPAEMSAGAVLRPFRQALRNDGAWLGYPAEGGFIRISEAFADTIIKTGGKILTGALCREISVRDGMVTGVVGESKEGLLKIEAPIVITNVPIVGLFQLVSPDHFPKWFIERVRFLDQYLYDWSSCSFGVTVISRKPLHDFKGSLVNPAESEANIAGPRSIRWLSHPTNIIHDLTPPGIHYFGYGNTISRTYADLLRDMRSIYLNEEKALQDELWRMFPSFDQNSIIQSRSGLSRLVDCTMQFPGNSWRQRLDVKSPAVEGLNFVGDMMRGWGGGTDLAAHSGILCAERILRTNVVDTPLNIQAGPSGK